MAKPFNPSRRPSFVPRIEAFPQGIWRLLWLGGVRESTDPNNPTGYDVRVHLSWGGKGDPPIIKPIWLPLSQLTYLRPKSRWEDGYFRAHPPGEQMKFVVRSSDAALHSPWDPGNRDGDLLTIGDYYFEKQRDLAKCWVFSTQNDEQLVVPAWEVLRAWYLFHHDVMPAVLAGAIRNPATLRRQQQPWLPGTGPRSEDGELQYKRPHWMNEAQATRMARLVFDDHAYTQAYDIFRQLMLAKEQAGSDRTAALPLPAVKPPFSGDSTWTVRCTPISPSTQGQPRFLVLSLDGAQSDHSFDHIHMMSEWDQGENKDDPALPQRHGKSKAPIDPNSSTELSLIGAAPDPSIQSGQIEGFDFYDDIVDKVKIVPLQKLEQVSRFQHTPSDPVLVAGGATDPAARPRNRYTRVETEGSYPPLAPDDLLHQTLDAFGMVIAQVGGAESTWQALLVTRDGGSTYPVRSRKTGQVRHFAILQVKIVGATSYVLEAQRFAGEEFSLCICRSASNLPMAPSLFESWLSGFPAPRGSPWAGGGLLPPVVKMAHKTVPHQPRNSSKSEVTAQLAERLRRRLWEFAMT